MCHKDEKKKKIVSYLPNKSNMFILIINLVDFRIDIMTQYLLPLRSPIDLTLSGCHILIGPVYGDAVDDGFGFIRACSIALVRGTASMLVAVASVLCRRLFDASRSVSNAFFNIDGLCYHLTQSTEKEGYANIQTFVFELERYSALAVTVAALMALYVY